MPRGPGTKGLGAVRRVALLTTTCEVIAEKGFGGTRTADVARAAGVSQALLFYHFGSKERLFALAFAHAAERDLAELEALLAAGGEPVPTLRALLRLYSPENASKAWPLWIDAWSESMRNPELDEMARRLDLRWKQGLTSVIESGVAAGTFTCPAPDDTAWRVLSLIDGLAVQVTVHQRRLPRTRLTALVRDAVAQELAIDPAELT